MLIFLMSNLNKVSLKGQKSRGEYRCPKLKYDRDAYSVHQIGKKQKLQKFSAQELKERNMAWVPKRSIQTQDKDDSQAKDAMQLKKKRRYDRRSPNLRFASNHQSYWSLHRPFCHANATYAYALEFIFICIWLSLVLLF